MLRLALAISISSLLIFSLHLFSPAGSNEVAAYAPPGAGNSAPLASFHLWDINEIFSCADGSIQFIEMVTQDSNQQFLAGHVLQATNSGGSQVHSFIFPSDAPGDSADKSLLIATAGFGSLPGGVTPDFVIPSNFLFKEDGSISLIEADTLTYSAGQLPLDGVKSLIKPGGVISSSINSPKNFAGDPGSIACPASLAVSKKGPATVAISSLMTYTLIVSSSGAFSNTNVILTDTIPAGSSFVSADVAPSGNVLTWTLGDLQPPLAIVSRTFVVTVTAPAGSVVANSNYGVRSDQDSATGPAIQASVINPAPTDTLTYLPVIFKKVVTVDEHAADLP
jgi:uncharacterized repeat protein (TIGR01451 family)